MGDTPARQTGPAAPVLSSTEASLKLVVLSHTHWDREWHLPFQEFRLLLIKAMDELLAILSTDPEYRYFLLDGQTVVLEDYLEMRPERRAEIEQHVSSGRIMVGPWYVLPDEFLVSGEALVRNLLLGHYVARSFGRPMKVGYLPDQFGHIAQMPQILRGFDIESAVVWRGIDSLNKSEFIWRSPDGSEVLALHLPCGYFNAVALPTDPEQLMVRLETIISELKPSATTPSLVLMNGGDHFSPQSSLSKVIKLANTYLSGAEMIHGNLPQLMKDLRRSYEENGSGWPVVTGELRENRVYHLLQGVLSARMWIKQRNAACENLLEKWAEPFSAWAAIEASLNRPLRGPFTSAASWRQPLRLGWKYLLQNQPHDSICGCSVDQVHEEMKTRFDWSEQIAEMVTKEALEILVAHVDTASLAQRPDSFVEVAQSSDLAQGSPIPIVVFNPGPGPRTDFVAVTTLAPSGNDLSLSDAAGRARPLQVVARRAAKPTSFLIGLGEMRGMLASIGLSSSDVWDDDKAEAFLRMLLIKAGQSNHEARVSRLEVDPAFSESCATLKVDTVVDRQRSHQQIEAGLRDLVTTIEKATRPFFMLTLQQVSYDEVDLGFVAQEIPGHGYLTYQLCAGQAATRPASATSNPSNRLENEFLVVEASREDGTLTLTDKESGTVYAGLNRFVDGGDCGDEYNYDEPVHDAVVTQPVEGPEICLFETGPARSTLRVDTLLRLPSGLAADRKSRTSETVECSISSFISLYPGVKRVDIHTDVDNKARDHRLRVHFPTGAQTHVSLSEGHFEVIRRPLEPPAAAPDAVEAPVRTLPQKTFVRVADDEVSLAVANRGLPEGEVIDTVEGAEIALTLLRSVGWLSRGDMRSRRGPAGPIMATPGAQCLGQYGFDYALIPGAFDWEEVLPQAHWFNNPMRAASTDLHPGHLPLSESLVEVKPDSLVVSALKVPEEGEGLIVRLYNPSADDIRAAIKVAHPFQKAELVNLEETTFETLEGGDDTVGLVVEGRRIITLRFSFPARG
ncbi:MAG: glycosyl hydrolase-related protein [Chloroflexi bacterium]|nr:glycosyl hydrolase-related protein [Chloroflexota bacterium]